MLRQLASAIESGIIGFRRACGQGVINGAGVARLGALVACAAAGLCGFAGLGALLVVPSAVALPAVLLSAVGVGALGLTALVLARSAVPNEVTTPQTPADHRSGEPAEDVGPWLVMTRAGVVRSCNLAQGGARFEDGDQVMDRIHVGDRVAWMRALSEARDSVEGTVAVDVRLNQAGLDGPQEFVPVRLMLWRGSDNDLAMMVAPQPAAAIEPDQSDAVVSPDTGYLADGNHLAMVGHELRTPLNAIIGFSELLRGDTIAALPVERQREYVALINDAASHLLSIVNAMLDVSKIDAGRYVINRESFDLRATVRDVADMVVPRAAEKSIHLNVHLEKVDGNANADRRAIKQILINLISNAIKFTPDQGCVTIEAETDSQSLYLTVADTGIGIAADDLSRLGQPFQQVDNSYTRQCEGTGLGLSLVKGLVGLHGGRLSIDSTPDVGTRVTVAIPFTDAQTAGAPSESRSAVTTLSRTQSDDGTKRDEGNEDASRRYG